MASLKGFLPPAGSALWRKDRGRLSSESEDSSSPTIKHVVIREVWQRSFPSPHAVYKIDVMTKSNHWFVFRRYREFLELHKKLVALYAIPKDMLPPKKLTSNMALCHLEKRKSALEHYLQRLVNSTTYVSTSPEILEFLEVQRHDVMSVTKALAKDLFQNGEDVLAKGESFTLTPTQLYCITRQLQLPESTNPVEDADAADLGILYDFIYQLRSLCVSSVVSKVTTSQELSSHLEFDISLFKSLSCLIIDGCPLTLINNLSKVQAQVTNLTARYCLTSMKELLVDCAAEKRLAPKLKGSMESWRTLTTTRLMQDRVVVQPWHQLTHLTLTHNKLAVFDNSLKLLPVLQNLDMSYNEFVHLDLQQLCCPSLMYLNMSHNNIHFVTGMPGGLPHLKSLALSHNNLETVCGLDSLTGLIELNIDHNQVCSTHEISKLSLNAHLKYLSLVGNPFARVKPYRLSVLSYFKDRNLILDKRPVTKKESVKLKSYPSVKLRASSSPDHILGDDTACDNVRPDRSHSFNLFGPPESDDDSGIEGAASLTNSNVVIDPDDYNVSDRELLFSWSYYSGKDAMPGGNIACFPCEVSQEEQKELRGATSGLLIEKAKTHGSNMSECLEVDHDSIKRALTVKDESMVLGSTSTLEAEESTTHCGSSSDVSRSAELTGHEEQLLTNTSWSPDNACLSQHVFNKETADDESMRSMLVRTEACEQAGQTNLHSEQQLIINKSIGCDKQMSHELTDTAERITDTSDSDECSTTVPNLVESLKISNGNREN